MIRFSILTILLVSLAGCLSESSDPTADSIVDEKTENISLTKSARLPLFESEVLSIFEDSRGIFWFGSRSDGLCCYDGHEYTYFGEADGIRDGQVSRIQEDANHTIWFTTSGSLLSFDGTNWKRHDLESIVQTAQVKPTTAKNTASLVWFGTPKHDAMLSYDGQHFEYLSLPETRDPKELRTWTGQAAYTIFDHFVDQEGALWISTFRTGVFRFNEGAFVHLSGDEFRGPAVRSIFQDRSGLHWLGDNDMSVYHWTGGRITNFTDDYGRSHKRYVGNDRKSFDSDGPDFLSRVWAIEQDNRGDIWFGTIGMGAWRYDGNTLTSFPIAKGELANSIQTIHKDNEGTLWFGTHDGDVVTFKKGSVVSFARTHPSN